MQGRQPWVLGALADRRRRRLAMLILCVYTLLPDRRGKTLGLNTAHASCCSLSSLVPSNTGSCVFRSLLTALYSLDRARVSRCTKLCRTLMTGDNTICRAPNSLN